MTAQQTLQQRVVELETANKDLAHHSQDMKREVERLTIKLAELLLHRYHHAHAPTYQYTEPYQMFFEQFPLPLAIYRTDGTLVAMNAQHKQRFQSAYAIIHGCSNLLTDPQARANGYGESFRRATQGEMIKVAVSANVGHHASGELASDDQDVWCDVLYLPLYDQPGNVLFIIAMILDTPCVQ